ncbi:hypothetical protein NQ166_09380 [Microbacterium sp. zg.Y1090]|uniref:hypothetical protein n=1 Tax=Microbacterium wangruii TaxID=3049073 RepID=UPI00214D23A5|nr:MULTISPECIES: hypothetical protein [unclassified Microbacterium]MCR2819038.1 hypothetical protein [Microbacterium sp. zg.Y1090]MDL5487688.1 hypothetical protein [Microbacterium sp. zg-Y1211]WIM27342.1 hypothetical protein QNO26_09190 [Microbacterium sp. zg-Y1090]
MSQYAASGTDASEVTEFQVLRVLFDADPLVGFDERGWYLSATALDAADDRREAWAVRDTAEGLLQAMNGIAALLRSDSHANPARLTHVYDGQATEMMDFRVTAIYGYSTSTNGLDPASADALLRLAAREPWVRRIFALLQHIDDDWVWIDLWRVWDLLIGHFKGKAKFVRWLESLDPSFAEQRVSFENSANDPSLGDNRRHGSEAYYTPREAWPGYVPPPMEWFVAVEFVKSVVAEWMMHTYGVSFSRQPGSGGTVTALPS